MGTKMFNPVTLTFDLLRKTVILVLNQEISMALLYFLWHDLSVGVINFDPVTLNNFYF